ncbi:unnamed protein product [Bursaphelenchus xylophilus]|uniref:(pine wood nematode) hypothetical protein n=1 Tax=Bursaphelenchus xylophilus TaxID=6326 RepID=A0A1I7RZU5_BURXY|nr:unnamed protein product [Bursaphelenchus xylophilus]CAG9109229.1 unnamed protein product [Bursaphelenchus xylophilus]
MSIVSNVKVMGCTQSKDSFSEKNKLDLDDRHTFRNITDFIKNASLENDLFYRRNLADNWLTEMKCWQMANPQWMTERHYLLIDLLEREKAEIEEIIYKKDDN